jgi:isopentenyl-diphosphate delta-isomerase
MMELVVLVSEDNEVLGTANKSTVHGETTPLHRAFSVFIFDHNNRLLLQQRSAQKQAWPFFWSNSCCGHPALHESNIQAVIRRCQFELGIEVTDIVQIAPYRYCFTDRKIMENEICPILVARCQTQPNANPDEVQATQWIDWQQWLQKIRQQPHV